MRITQASTTALLAGSLAMTAGLTPAAAAWHGGTFHGHHGGAALGAGLALGALGALGAFGTPYYYGYYDAPYAYDGPGCVQRYWRHGGWHVRYLC